MQLWLCSLPRKCLQKLPVQETATKGRREGGEAQQTWILRPCAASSSPAPQGSWLSLHVASKAPHITNVFHEGLSASHHA